MTIRLISISLGSQNFKGFETSQTWKSSHITEMPQCLHWSSVKRFKFEFRMLLSFISIHDTCEEEEKSSSVWSSQPKRRVFCFYILLKFYISTTHCWLITNFAKYATISTICYTRPKWFKFKGPKTLQKPGLREWSTSIIYFHEIWLHFWLLRWGNLYQ